MQKVVWGWLANSWEEKRSKRQRRKGKIYPPESRIPKNSKERLESFPKWTMPRKEENNRMEKTKDLLKNIRDTKGTLHAQ